MLDMKMLATLSILTLICAMSSVAQEPVLHFDASNNPGHPNWTNLGTAGGELERVGNTQFEPADDGNPARYTSPEMGAIFLSEDGEPSVNLESWTIVMHCKNNGDLFGAEEQLFVISAEPMQLDQAIRSWIDSDWVVNDGTGRIGLIIKGTATVQEIAPSNTPETEIGLDEWHTVAFVYDNDLGLYEGYLDGELVSEKVTDQDFDAKVEMPLIRIFTGDGIERNFNGSVSTFTVYDEALSAEQLIAGAAVEPTSKLAVTWGNVKTTY